VATGRTEGRARGGWTEGPGTTAVVAAAVGTGAEDATGGGVTGATSVAGPEGVAAGAGREPGAWETLFPGRKSASARAPPATTAIPASHGAFERRGPWRGRSAEIAAVVLLSGEGVRSGLVAVTR